MPEAPSTNFRKLEEQGLLNKFWTTLNNPSSSEFKTSPEDPLKWHSMKQSSFLEVLQARSTKHERYSSLYQGESPPHEIGGFMPREAWLYNLIPRTIDKEELLISEVDDVERR